MNERIQELERQAQKFVLDIPASLDINEFTSIFNEKFAELIVQECAGLVKGQPHFDKMLDCATVIKQHFGVES